MTYISPILSKRLNNNLNSNSNNNNKLTSKARHEEIYEDLTQHANDVKPNEAKAKLVKENPAQAAVSYVKDLKKDTTNFFKAVKTGKMNDNSLGRINDLGLKAGGLLIASYLAAHAKTKTDAIMKFIGGGAFFASMSLWPKLFINTPAKIVHGFDIGQKYISAQGDKKDFFLDNQFLPWDAYSDEELKKIGKHNGIDINSENGKEKIQRKMQKVALQNRTLWMATAGFATPLMTALICDKVEPYVSKAVISKQFKKTQEAIKSGGAIEQRFKEIDSQAAKAIAGTQETPAVIGDIFKNKTCGTDEFFSELADTLSIRKINISDDNAKAINGFTYERDSAIKALKKLYSNSGQITNIDMDGIEQILKDNGLEAGIFSSDVGGEAKLFLDELKNEPNMPVARFEELLEKCSLDGRREDIYKHITSNQEENFKQTISKFYTGTVLPTREKLKIFLEDALNPVLGEKSESQSTVYITDSIKKLLERIHPDKKGLETLKGKEGAEVINTIQGFFSNLVKDTQYGSKEYNKIIQGILTVQQDSNGKPLLEGISGTLEGLIPAIRPQLTEETAELSKTIMGSDNGSLFDSILPAFIQEKNAAVNAFGTRAAICANFEARLKDGKIMVDGQNLKENEELLKCARKIMYEGNFANLTDKAGMQKMFPDVDTRSGRIDDAFGKLMEALFGKDAFEADPDIVKQEAKNILTPEGGITKQYLQNVDITDQIKDAATRLFNNKSWKKIFVPMSIALVAITLLVQPLFGKIDKEYPENKKGGNK